MQMIQAFSCDHAGIRAHLKELIQFEFENRSDDFCFMSMLRCVTNVARSDPFSYSEYAEVTQILAQLIEEI